MNTVKLSALIAAGITLAFHVWFIRDHLRRGGSLGKPDEMFDVAVTMFAALFVVVLVIVSVVKWGMNRQPGAWEDWSMGSLNVNLTVTIITLVSVVGVLREAWPCAFTVGLPVAYVAVAIFDDGK